MKPETVNSDRLAEAVEALRQEVARLGQRVAALEKGAPSPPTPLPQRGEGSRTVPPSPTRGEGGRGGEGAEGISEEILLVISAAVAAFLGKKPHIRQIRLLGTTAWAQQGRVTIQASHALAARHTRSPH
jgi:methylmalonyl-CoA carboxyltransferase 12S subunit